MREKQKHCTVQDAMNLTNYSDMEMERHGFLFAHSYWQMLFSILLDTPPIIIDNHSQTSPKAPFTTE